MVKEEGILEKVELKGRHKIIIGEKVWRESGIQINGESCN
jgi:hypothetical protein